jgi:hypothetical protein
MTKRITLLFFLMPWLLSYSQQRQLPIKVIEASSQYWISGAPGGRTGTKYAIKIYIRTDKKLEFLDLWLGKENVPFDVEFYSQGIQKMIQQGDSLLLTYNQIRGEEEDFKAKRIPFPYKGAALIETRVDGRRRYFTVSKLKQLPRLEGM